MNRQKRAAERRKRKYANWLDDACATGDPKYAAGALVRYIGRGPTNGKLADVVSAERGDRAWLYTIRWCDGGGELRVYADKLECASAVEALGELVDPVDPRPR